MAPTIRYTGIPTSLWAEGSWFIERSGKAQLLYFQLWTSDDRDAAGFVPLQPDTWARRSTTSSPESVRAALAELVEHDDVLTDERAGKAWLRRFIEDDAFSSPNIYIGAMNRIRTCPSRALRIAAGHEVQRLGLPYPKSEKTREKTTRRLEAAYYALTQQLMTDGEQVSADLGLTPAPTPTKTSTSGGFETLPQTLSKPFPNGSERVSDLLCANGCDAGAGPDGYCDSCVKAQKW